MVAKVEAAAVVRIAVALKTNKQKLSGFFGGPDTLPGLHGYQLILGR